jgi:hypothetical protein
LYQLWYVRVGLKYFLPISVWFNKQIARLSGNDIIDRWVKICESGVLRRKVEAPDRFVLIKIMQLNFTFNGISQI